PTGEKGPRSQGSRHLDDAVEEERVCAGNGVGESFRGNAGDDNIRQRPPVRRNEVAVGLDFVFFTVHRRSPDQFDIGTRPRRGDVQRLAAGENSVGGDHGADDVVDWVRALVRNAQEPGNGVKAGKAPLVRITICSKLVPGFVLLRKYGGAVGRLLTCDSKSPLSERLYNSNSTEALVCVMLN